MPLVRLACAALALAAAGRMAAAVEPPPPSDRTVAIGDPITDIRVENNSRTDDETIRSIAGVSIGDELRVNTLDVVRERLHTSGLFADVDVFWKPHRHGVSINIVIKDKFPWAPVPTFSYSPGNISGGLVVAHGNLFGRGKRGLIGGRLSTADSGALVVYEDPAVWGSWIFFNLRGRAQEQILPEYTNVPELAEPVTPIRETQIRSYAGDVSVGIAWFRKVRTSVGWSVERYTPIESRGDPDRNPYSVEDPELATDGAIRGVASANLTFDFRAREHAITYGNALAFSLDHGSPRWGSDDTIDYWKATVSYEQGLRLFRTTNLVLRLGATAGERLPMVAENSAGGTNLRGFLHRQFIGDTHLRSQVEYHFPLFSIGKLDVRGLVFNDAAAIWFRKLPPVVGDGAAYERREDGRLFLAPDLLQAGFDRRRDIHTSVGGGIRFYLRSVAVPLVGVDVGHGIDTGTVRVLIVVGA